MLIPAVGAAQPDSAWPSLFLMEDHGVLRNSDKANSQTELPPDKARHTHRKTISAVSAVPKDTTAAASRASQARRSHKAKRIFQGLMP